LRDALAGWRGGGLKNERQEQRGLAHQHEMRCSEPSVADRIAPGRAADRRRTADGLLQRARSAAADFGIRSAIAITVRI
jgi:hypothetical protein